MEEPDLRDLHSKFNLNEPWDSPRNIHALKHMPEIYLAAGQENVGKTSMLVFTGEGTPFGGEKGISFQDVPDGLSNTLMIVQAGPDKAVPWTKPEDIPFDGEITADAFGTLEDGMLKAVFFDGHIEMLNVQFDLDVINAMITHAGGEEVERGDGAE